MHLLSDSINFTTSAHMAYLLVLNEELVVQDPGGIKGYAQALLHFVRACTVH